MRLALEMRLTGGSNVILAPQRGNSLGTVSIEVLTPLNTSPADWQEFLQQISDLWTSYRGDGGKGEYLNSRPHWAKEWQGLTVRGQPIIEYLKNTAYPAARVEFVEVLKKIAESKGSGLDESRKRFGNPLLETLLF
jgi:hypothetical protein